MTSMLVNGVEHIVWGYNDDTGHGMTVCESAIGPQDVGPRFEPANCQKCLGIQAENKRVLAGLGNYFCLDLKCGWTATHESRPLSKGTKVGCPVCNGEADYR